jgi:hypothetical protein
MWAAIIKTINNLLRRSMASSMGAPKWNRAGVSICPERDHAGRARKVPQEDRSPSMYIDQYTCILVKRYSTFFWAILTGKPIFKIHTVQYVHVFITNKRCAFFLCLSCVHIITDVYFRRLKINHESHEFILDPGTVANRRCLFYVQGMNRFKHEHLLDNVDTTVDAQPCTRYMYSCRGSVRKSAKAKVYI